MKALSPYQPIPGYVDPKLLTSAAWTTSKKISGNYLVGTLASFSRRILCMMQSRKDEVFLDYSGVDLTPEELRYNYSCE